MTVIVLLLTLSLLCKFSNTFLSYENDAIFTKNLIREIYGIPKNSNLCVQQFMQVLFYGLILDSFHSLPIFLLFFSENETEKDIIP